MSMPVLGRGLSQSSWIPVVLGRGRRAPNEKKPSEGLGHSFDGESLMDPVQASVPHQLQLSCGEMKPGSYSWMVTVYFKLKYSHLERPEASACSIVCGW